MSDGFFRPKYTDRHGKVRTAKFWWTFDPVARKRVSTGCTDIKAAKAWKAERERRAADPHYSAAHEATISGLIDELLERKNEDERADGTITMYRQKLGHVARVFGEHAPMATITPEAVDRYRTQRRAEGASNNTIGKEFTAIRQLVRLAARSRRWRGDLAALFPMHSIEYEPRSRFATVAELELLRTVLEPRQHAMCLFIVCTSARLSEALRALPGHYRDGFVTLLGTKTETSARTVPVLPPFRGWFEQAIRFAPYDWHKITKYLPAACARLEIPPLTPNDLRRTHAVMLRSWGVRPADIAPMLGHVDSKMVERVYGRMSPEALRDVLEAQISSKTVLGAKTRKRTK